MTGLQTKHFFCRMLDEFGSRGGMQSGLRFRHAVGRNAGRLLAPVPRIPDNDHRRPSGFDTADCQVGDGPSDIEFLVELLQEADRIEAGLVKEQPVELSRTPGVLGPRKMRILFSLVRSLAHGSSRFPSTDKICLCRRYMASTR